MSEAEVHRARSGETLAIILQMEAALGANSNEMARCFHEDFVWRGNADCGEKTLPASPGMTI